MRQILTWLGRIGAILSLLFLGWKFYQNYNKIHGISLDKKSVFIISLALILIVLVYLISSFTWKLLMQVSGSQIRYRDAMRIFFITQIGKYLPGNIFHFVGRVTLARSINIETKYTVTSIILESFVVIVAAGICSLSGLVSEPELIRNIYQEFFKLNLEIIYFIIFFILLIFLAGIFFSKGKVSMKITLVKKYIHKENIVYILSSLLIFILIFFIYAFVLYEITGLLLKGVLPVTLYGFFWGFSLAWVAGYIIPGAPGGIGIREAIFIFLFKRKLGEAAALELAFIIRLLMIAGDVVAFFIGNVMKIKKRS